MKEPKDFTIRFSEPEDGGPLLKWLSDPECLRWFPFGNEKEIAVGVNNWIGFSRFHSSLTGTIQNKPVAIGTLFLMPYRKVAHHCMFYLIVDPDHQNKGVGTSMVKNLLNLAEKYFHLESVHAEVYGGCAILPVLKKLHFEEFAFQEKFVKEGKEYLSRILLEHFF